MWQAGSVRARALVVLVTVSACSTSPPEAANRVPYGAEFWRPRRDAVDIAAAVERVRHALQPDGAGGASVRTSHYQAWFDREGLRIGLGAQPPATLRTRRIEVGGE